MKRFWYLHRRPETIQSDIDEELRLHLEMRADDLVARGLSRDRARREAERQFGRSVGHARVLPSTGRTKGHEDAAPTPGPRSR